MKKRFFLYLALLFCFSCNEKPKYFILGEVTNPEWENYAVRLFSVDSLSNVAPLAVDTIREGKFSFLHGGNNGLAYIEFEADSELWRRYLLLEANSINVLIDSDMTVTGTPANNEYQDALNSEIRLDSIENCYYKAKENGTLTAELEKKTEEESENQFEKTKESYAVFFRNNINNSLGKEIFANSRWTRRLSPGQLESVLEKCGDDFKQTALYHTYSERLHNMKTSVPGYDYKEIVSKNPEGKEMALSDYVGKGKYVLLDFWASWCPSCREEMPNLVKLYNIYKGKNFEIVAYSLDKNEETWKKGIKTLKMTWPQMSDCAHWDSPAVKSYAVQGIPCTILIDPDGKIIERGLEGEKLAETLKNLVK